MPKLSDLESQDIMHEYYHAYSDTVCDSTCPRWLWTLAMAKDKRKQ